MASIPGFCYNNEENTSSLLERMSTNLYEAVKDFKAAMITSDVLGKAFEPEARFENPDGSDIIFNTDYAGNHRGESFCPGPFAEGGSEFVVW